MSEVDEYYNEVIELGICSEETLQVVTDINGYSIDTINDVIYACTGYRSLEQYKGEE